MKRAKRTSRIESFWFLVGKYQVEENNKFLVLMEGLSVSDTKYSFFYIVLKKLILIV